MSRRLFRSSKAQQAPGRDISMQLRLNKAVSPGKPVTIDPNDGSGPIELQPGDSYVCPGGGGESCTPSPAGPYWIMATNKIPAGLVQISDPEGTEATTTWEIRVPDVYSPGGEGGAATLNGHVAVARVIGELCDSTVEWTHEYQCIADPGWNTSHAYGQFDRFDIYEGKWQGVSSGSIFTLIAPAVDPADSITPNSAGQITLTASVNGVIVGQITLLIHSGIDQG